MKRLFTLLILSTFLVNCSSTQGLGDLVNKAKKVLNGEEVTTEEAGMGLKEALNKGVDEAVSFLAAEDGYYATAYKILLPEEAQQVTDKLRGIPGFSDAEEKLVLRLNRAAEQAAAKAKPIFASSIKQMTFEDAMNILLGEADAATRYLERTTYDQLYQEFQPVVIEALDEVNARSYWKELVTAYNKIPFIKKVNPELDDHVTTQALTGLFDLVEKEEAEIRKDPAARTTELLKKVFAKQDK